jgi:hypothetical protein
MLIDQVLQSGEVKRCLHGGQNRSGWEDRYFTLL